MLIVILGTPYAGKDLLASELVETHKYTRVHISSQATSTTSKDLFFASSSDFLDYATQYWRRDFVTTDLRSKTKLVEFAKRPFVALVAVEAPLGIRFSRAVAGAKQQGRLPPSLEDFIALDDLANFGTSSPIASPNLQPPSTPQKQKLSTSSNAPPSPTPSPPRPTRPLALLHDVAIEPLAPLLPLVHHTFVNPFSEPALFYNSIRDSLASLSDKLRPPWDTYFMHLATLASLRSNCMKRRVGAVLVRERRVVSTGYNGTPRNVTNCNEGGCKRCNSYGDGMGTQGNGTVSEKAVGGPLAMGVGLDECLCLHAEENALLEAGRERVSGGGTPGAVLYCNTCPCLRCTVKIVQCGVTEVVYSLSYSMDDSSRRVMEEAGIKVRQIEMPDPFSRA